MSSITVREAALADADAIRRVAERGWKATYGHILPTETIDTALDEWYTVDGTRAAIEREDIGYFVAERAGDVVGYVSGGSTDEDGVAVLGAIYVDPNCWNEGIGTALLETFETFCREQGDETIRFRVLSENDVGASFYKRHGYEVAETEETDLFGETVLEDAYRGQIDESR